MASRPVLPALALAAWTQAESPCRRHFRRVVWPVLVLAVLPAAQLAAELKEEEEWSPQEVVVLPVAVAWQGPEEEEPLAAAADSAAAVSPALLPLAYRGIRAAPRARRFHPR